MIIQNGVRFSKPHMETCDFEHWSRAEKKIVKCGQKAIGSFKKAFLCEEHFGYSISLSGVKFLTEVER